MSGCRANHDVPVDGASGKKFIKQWESLDSDGRAHYESLARRLQSQYDQQVAQFRRLGSYEACLSVEMADK